MLAILLYTFDFQEHIPEHNMYHILNEDLRTRQPGKMNAWSGYLHFLHEALEKLPPFQGTVYRGVIAYSPEERERISREYKRGRLISWSGLTSTSSKHEAAHGFAGPQGVVFEVTVLSGRSLGKVSHFSDCEEETLLGANSRFVVLQELHTIVVQRGVPLRPVPVWTIMK
eukprot:TRINITY_DN23241_c0_g1_i1.p1 TRINITY_DN23241_c0_g1~~TRINITY_DN23241_c0_g1_i1.p1  ORF type:complete len:189 (-),score=45.32 TRINITY_DN23241_c0_g1_i1:63-572(-)